MQQSHSDHVRCALSNSVAELIGFERPVPSGYCRSMRDE